MLHGWENLAWCEALTHFCSPQSPLRRRALRSLPIPWGVTVTPDLHLARALRLLISHPPHLNPFPSLDNKVLGLPSPSLRVIILLPTPGKKFFSLLSASSCVSKSQPQLRLKMLMEQPAWRGLCGACCPSGPVCWQLASSTALSPLPGPTCFLSGRWEDGPREGITEDSTWTEESSPTPR